MGGRKGSLDDLVEFEARLYESASEDRRSYREAVAEVRKWPKGEAARPNGDLPREGPRYFLGTARTGPTEIPPSTRRVWPVT